MMLSRKIAGCAGFLLMLTLGACNLASQSASAAEVALNPPTLEPSVTVVVTALPLTAFPTRTPLSTSPTITVLDAARPTAVATLAPTAPPPEGVCSLKAIGDYDVNVRRGPGTNFSIISALEAGQYAPVVAQDVSGWLQIAWVRGSTGWVSPKVVTLYGPCNALLIPNPVPLLPADMQPTPTAYFQSELGMNVYRVMTTTAIGDVPAGTTVRVSSASYINPIWNYEVVTRDGRAFTATQSQLAFIPNAGGGGATPTTVMQATATIPVMELPTDVSLGDVVLPDGLCVVVAQAPTNLVSVPNGSDVIGVMKPGPWAQVSATNGQGWYKVTIWTDGRQGWGSTATLKLNGPCDALPVESGS